MDLNELKLVTHEKVYCNGFFPFLISDLNKIICYWVFQ